MLLYDLSRSRLILHCPIIIFSEDEKQPFSSRIGGSFGGGPLRITPTGSVSLTLPPHQRDTVGEEAIVVCTSIEVVQSA